MTTILCIGDSNTYGYDPRSYLGSRYPDNICWTGLLTTPERKVINCGQNGLCVPSAQSYAIYDGLILKNMPDLITIMLGTNDLLNRRSAEYTAERMDGFVAHICSHSNPRVLLLSPPHLQIGEWVQDQNIIEESFSLGCFYRAIAEKYSITYANTADWNIDVLFDGVHFSPEGHRKFADKVATFL